jgi:dihydroneopterin aldolase
MPDCIHIRGLTFHAFHGVNPEEAAQGQKFVIDADLFLALAPAGEADDLSLTVNYAQVVKTIKSIVTGERCLLIEALAERLSAALLAKYPLESVRLEVHKPQAPLRDVFQDVSVEIYRHAR